MVLTVSCMSLQNVTLAIVMELCRLGTLFKVIECAHKVSKLPVEVLSGAVPPRSEEERKLKVSRHCTRGTSRGPDKRQRLS